MTLEKRAELELKMLKSDLEDPEYTNDQLEVDRLLDAINRLKKDPKAYFKEIDKDDE